MPNGEAKNFKILATDATLPSDSSNILYKENSAIDSIQMIRFETSLSSLKELIKKIQKDRRKYEENPDIKRYAKSDSWWTDKYNSNVKGVGLSKDGHSGIEISWVVNGNQATVWLVSFTV